jgi:hypothetical protein
MVGARVELGGWHENIEIYSIRKLLDLTQKDLVMLPEWKRLMRAKKRKTLAACRNCHNRIYNGEYDGRKLVT